MADVVDQANECAEMQLQCSISNSSMKVGPSVTGYCLYCGEQLHSSHELHLISIKEFEGVPRRWCDADCRDWWQEGQV